VRGAVVTLYHYTCGHSAADIDAAGKVLPGFVLTERATYWPSRFAWFTDMSTPERDALGLTMHSIICDRTEHRYRVTDPTEVMPWHVVARSVPRDQREALESASGARPMHWFVAVCGVSVVRDPLERAS
jgi:hypothetical protein